MFYVAYKMFHQQKKALNLSVEGNREHFLG